MSKLTGYRILAFGVDYLIIAVYAVALFGATTFLDVGKLSPAAGQLVGFLTLTLPVFLYFYLMENSSRAATVGKRVMNISVHTDSEKSSQKVFIRNILKFLPWEVAHVGVHWVIYYSALDQSPPAWVWIALILPQVIVLGYLVSIVLSKGESSFYDKLASTRIERSL
ncbi:RDD family protein [Rhodohalobacter sp.]|uniref:RDD family protein n=1 Tax=Rhodohalobacter sp. TaxID=1974210 RepID=UPI002ACD2B9D|nr:RDD family protein [Rhodohalobacter sp.]MDZ7755982.1 RDD family protein [Rhodohalobacter sp.]